jgi:hypothetical protein
MEGAVGTKRKRSRTRAAREAILNEAERLSRAGVNVMDKRIVIGGRHDESVSRAMKREKLMIDCDWCGKTIDEDNIWVGPGESTLCEECYATGGKKDVKRQG